MNKQNFIRLCIVILSMNIRNEASSASTKGFGEHAN